MIVKIWPVKGVQGLKKAKLYIEDDNKVIKIEQDEEGNFLRRTIIDTQQEYHMDADRYYIENEEDISRVMAYMANEEKIKNKYISGYQCEPGNALAKFHETWDEVLRKAGPHKKIRNMEKENLSFHLVQSFPEELDISDEEVHQCGLELLAKIKNHQGIVSSHVHPVVDEEGEVHGRCKHNHILFNAYIQPDMIDPEHPEILKYNNCLETYAQLQIWNDEIAIEHGLPIIRDPDRERTYSWIESSEKQKGKSWTERIRLDIEASRRASNNWEEFVSNMERSGYKIRDGAHVTYTAPDGKHKARGNTLGQSYTKENLELYWTIRNRTEKAVEKAIKDNEAPPLWTLAERYGAISVNIPIGIKREEEPSFYSFPLEKPEHTREVLSTYFDEKDLYDIYDKQGRAVAAATGGEIIAYLEALRQHEEKQWEEQRRKKEEEEQQQYWQEEENRRNKEEKEEEKKKQRYYSSFRNSRTKRRYYVDLRDEDGRERSSVELLFLIAVTVIKSEDGLWYKRKQDDGKEFEIDFGPTDWKMQNMMDSIHVAAEEGLGTPAQIDERVNEVGAAYSRARSALQKTKRSQEKMEALDKALKDYDQTKELAERIHALQEGPEKEKLKNQYKDEIERYKKAKSVMYGYKVTTQDQIDDFRERYADIVANIPVMQKEFDKAKEDYRRIKKLQYNAYLAQKAQYCYGPAYSEEEAFNLNKPKEEQEKEI